MDEHNTAANKEKLEALNSKKSEEDKTGTFPVVEGDQQTNTHL